METSISLQVRLFQPSQSNTLSLLLGVDRPSSVNQHQEALYIEIHVKFGFSLIVLSDSDNLLPAGLAAAAQRDLISPDYTCCTASPAQAVKQCE